jgi:hypothetical protein
MITLKSDKKRKRGIIMKKIAIIIAVVVIGLTSSIGVYAAGVDKVSNMDAETFLETKLSYIEEALENEEISREDAIRIREHIMEAAEDGTFGRGFENANRLECDEDCIFEDGLRLQKADGTGNQDGTRGKGLGKGLGNGIGNGTGRGMARDGECILD